MTATAQNKQTKRVTIDDRSTPPTDMSSITPGSNQTPLSAREFAKALVSRELASLHNAIKRVSVDVFEKFLDQRILLLQSHQRKKKLDSTTSFIPQSVRFDVTPTGSDLIKDSQEFRALSTKFASELTEVSKMLKDCMHDAVELEIQARIQEIQKLYCKSLCTLATGCCKPYEDIDESMDSNFSLICSIIENEVNCKRRQAIDHAQLEHTNLHPLSQDSTLTSVLFTPPDPDVELDLLRYSGFRHTTKRFHALDDLFDGLKLHTTSMADPRDSCDESNYRYIAPARSAFRKIVYTIFFQGWEVYLCELRKNAKELELETWASTTLDVKETDNIQATISDINTQTATMEALVTKVVNERLKSTQNQLKQTRADLKALKNNTPTKTGKSPKSPSKNKGGVGVANKDTPKGKRNSKKQHSKKKTNGS